MPTAASPHGTARTGPPGAPSAGPRPGWDATRGIDAGIRTGAWTGFTLVEEGVSDAFRQSPGPEVE